MGGRVVAALALVAVLAGVPRAADLIVAGCNERNPGEVGVRELHGDVGDTVGVGITVHTTGPVDAFSLDLSFPAGLLSYVRTDPGDLTSSFFLLTGVHDSTASCVQISGLDPSPVPSGSVGRLAVVQFEVVAAGVDSFATGGYVDDLSGYDACEDINQPSPVRASAWGRLKALYR